MAYVTVDEVVREACADDGDTLHLYSDYLRYGLRGVREITIKYGIPLGTKSCMLPILRNNTVDLPKDYVDYHKIGLLMRNGNIAVLDLNPKMYPNAEQDSCGEGEASLILADTRSPEGIGAPYYFHNFYRNGRNIGALFGHGGAHNKLGAYRPNIDEMAWNIQLSSNIQSSHIVLEYTPNGINSEGGLTSINEFGYESLLYFIKWKRDESKKSVSLGEKLNSEKRFFSELDLMKRSLFAFGIEELKAATRKSFHLSIKN